MVFEVSPGKRVPIPCRHCGKPIRFTVVIGLHALPCSCLQSTRVFVTWESDTIRIRTAAQ